MRTSELKSSRVYSHRLDPAGHPRVTVVGRRKARNPGAHVHLGRPKDNNQNLRPPAQHGGRFAEWPYVRYSSRSGAKSSSNVNSAISAEPGGCRPTFR